MHAWDRFLLTFASSELKGKLSEAAGTVQDPDDHLYRKLTERTTADLSQWEHEKMLKVVLFLERKNPMARRLLDLIRDFVWAEGFSLTFVNNDVRDLVERHWHDPVNRWERRGPRLLRLLLRDGEVALPAAVNPVNGFVRYGTIPSRAIKDVKAHPENWEIIQQVVLYDHRSPIEGLPRDAINIDWDADSGQMAGRLSGEMFFWKIGADDGLRGISFLYALADYCDALDRLLFNEVERWQLLKSHIWDVTIEGATNEQIAHMVQTEPRFKSPRPASLRVHNQAEKWKAEAPDLKEINSVVGMRFVRNFIAGTSGFPEHWFGEGGDVNRAVGTVMDEPTIKMLTTIQRMFRDYMVDAIQFVVDKAVEHGELDPLVSKQDDEGNDTDEMIDPRDAFRLNAPDMSTKDMKDVATTLTQATMSLMQAVEKEWITDATAGNVFAAIASQLGVDVDAEAERMKIHEDREIAGNKTMPEDRQEQFAEATSNGRERS